MYPVSFPCGSLHDNIFLCLLYCPLSMMRFYDRNWKLIFTTIVINFAETFYGWLWYFITFYKNNLSQQPYEKNVFVIHLFQCGSVYDVDDIVILNGSPEEVDTLRDKMEEKRARAKAVKVFVKNTKSYRRYDLWHHLFTKEPQRSNCAGHKMYTGLWQETIFWDVSTNITSQILFIWKLKTFLLMLCGEVQNVQTLHTNTHYVTLTNRINNATIVINVS